MNDKTPKWTNFKEFAAGKTITPLSVERLCGDKTQSKYKDKDGCVYRMTYIDHDNADIERWYENSFWSFKNGLSTPIKVEKEHKYKVQVVQTPDGKWQWNWSVA